MVDVLTWQGLRALVTCEAIADGTRVRTVAPVARRPDDVVRLTKDNGSMTRYWPSVPLKTGGIVYARDTWRAPWRAALAQGTQPCVLVSAFHDAHITAKATDEMFRPGSPIRTWFGVQTATTHPQLRAMPLGVDGRKITALRRVEWRDREARDLPLFVNFNLRTEERHQVWRRFQHWPDGLATTWMPEGDLDYFTAMGRARFVLSPPGRGWDCYRTYEAIAMAVPIVRRQRPLSDVCNGLPVLQVDRWEDVTRELLDRTWETLTGSMEHLRLSYWAAQIRMAARAAKEQTYGTHV